MLHSCNETWLQLLIFILHRYGNVLAFAANIDTCTLTEEQTPVHYAARSDSVKALQVLVQHGGVYVCLPVCAYVYCEYLELNYPRISE